MQNQTYVVKGGCNEVIGLMTKAQALRHGNKNMPSDLKRAGFQTVIFQSDVEIHGASYIRINYGK